MAARLTDKQKKKIVADYLECGSLRATASDGGIPRSAKAGQDCNDVPDSGSCLWVRRLCKPILTAGRDSVDAPRNRRLALMRGVMVETAGRVKSAM